MGIAPALSDAAVTPGVVLSLSLINRQLARLASGLESLVGDEMKKVNKLWESNPGLTFQSLTRLRTISPVPDKRTRAKAISTTTKTPCARCRPPLEPRPPSFNVS